MLDVASTTAMYLGFVTGMSVGLVTIVGVVLGIAGALLIVGFGWRSLKHGILGYYAYGGSYKNGKRDMPGAGEEWGTPS